MEDVILGDNHVFNYPYSEYQVTLNPVREYLKQASLYMSKKFNITLEEAEKQVKLNIKNNNPKNPKLKFRFQDDTGDRVVKETTLLDYIKDVQQANEVLAPSFTSYYPKDKFPSIHAKFLRDNVKKRKEAKLLSFKFKQQGNKEKADYYNVLQKIMKILNNSLSGAYGSSSTVLYNPSAHYTLTSITRSLSSIGNAVTEVLVGGNRLFRTPEDVFNYITAIIANVSIEMVKFCVNKYSLKTPSPREVMDAILFSTRRYWLNLEAESRIYAYLERLDQYELAAVLYTNSLWDLKNHNEEFIKTMLVSISKKCQDIVNDKVWLEKCPEGIDILAKIICAKDIKGIDVDYEKLAGTDILNKLSSTACNIVKELRNYQVLINTFLKTPVMPINVAYIKEILRDNIVLSDTDSTCGAYDKWVEWYYGDILFTEEAVALSAVVMIFNTQAMDHNIKLFVRNMNVDPSDVELLKMKNEFQWSVFTPTNNTKHYFANTCIQEGNVFNEPELELKGVHLIAGAANKDIVSKIRKGLIEDINKRVSNQELLSLKHYVTFVADLERELESKLQDGDLDMYKLEKIKDPASYKLDDKTKTPYLYHMFWNEVMGPKYGTMTEPPYICIKIPTVLVNVTSFKAFVDSIKDIELKERFVAFCNRHSKTTLPTIRIPVPMVKSMNSIPEEIVPIIDYKRIAQDNLNSAYLTLETLGFYKKNNLLVKEQGY